MKKFPARLRRATDYIFQTNTFQSFGAKLCLFPMRTTVYLSSLFFSSLEIMRMLHWNPHTHTYVRYVSNGYMNPSYFASYLASTLMHVYINSGRGATAQPVYILASVNNQQSAVAAAMAAVTNCTCTHTN